MKQNKINKKHIRIDISSEFCFHTHYTDISITSEAYDYYEGHKLEANKILYKDVPISFDTNVLLNLYKVSFNDRNQMIEFINKNKQRIIITSQVQTEYMRNRRSHIQNFLKTLSDLDRQAKDVSTTFLKACDTAIEQLKQLGNRRIISDDMPDVVSHIQTLKLYLESHRPSETIKNEIDNLLTPLRESLKNGVDASKTQAVYELKDPILSALSGTNILETLKEEELDYLKQLFNDLLDAFTLHKNNVSEKEFYCFPGCGDRIKAKRGEEPYGDFIIYHELISYMRENNCDMIFFTNDVTKTDWVKENSRPFPHYIVDTYKNTKHMLYILNANSIIPVVMASVVDPEKDSKEGNLDSSLVTKVQNNEVKTIREEIKVNDTEPTEDNQDDKKKAQKGYYKDISEERFFDELDTTQKWVDEYSDGKVHLEQFVFDILGPKRFHYRSTFELVERLVREGKIIQTEEDIKGKKIRIIRASE